MYLFTHHGGSKEGGEERSSGNSASSSHDSQSSTPTAVPEHGQDVGSASNDKEERTPDGKIIHDWNGPNDPDNPFSWSTTYKWLVTFTVCFISILTGLPAGSYGSGNEYYSQMFNVQNRPFSNLYWATTSWNMGAALFPLLFVPLTEHSGRMPG